MRNLSALTPLLVLLAGCATGRGPALVIDEKSPLTADDLGFSKAEMAVELASDEVLVITEHEEKDGTELSQSQVNYNGGGRCVKDVIVLNDGLWNDGKITKFIIRTPLGHRQIGHGVDAGWSFGFVGNDIKLQSDKGRIEVVGVVMTYAEAKQAFPEIPDRKAGDSWSYNSGLTEKKGK